MKAYYAHPITLYGSICEYQDKETIKKAGFELINPNDAEKQAGYKREGMAFFEKIVKEADIVFFRSFPDGSIGSGIVQEVQWALQDEKPVFEMLRNLDSRSLSVDATREMLIQCGRRKSN